MSNVIRPNFDTWQTWVPPPGTYLYAYAHLLRPLPPKAKVLQFKPRERK